MSTDISKYVPLKQIVSYYLDEMGKSYADFDACWILAFRALVKMNFSIAAEPKTIRIPLNGNKTANLPLDYISWTKIGIQDSEGGFSTLKINRGLTKYADNSVNRISKIDDTQVNDSVGLLSSSPAFVNYFYNGTYAMLFGVGGGLIQHASCDVDEANKVIIFPPDFRYDSVLLEYIFSPQRDNDYQIQTCLQEAVIAFIKWKRKEGTAQEFYAMVIEGRRSLDKKKVTLQTINQVLRESDAMKLRS